MLALRGAGPERDSFGNISLNPSRGGGRAARRPRARPDPGETVQTTPTRGELRAPLSGSALNRCSRFVSPRAGCGWRARPGGDRHERLPSGTASPGALVASEHLGAPSWPVARPLLSACLRATTWEPRGDKAEGVKRDTAFTLQGLGIRTQVPHNIYGQALHSVKSRLNAGKLIWAANLRPARDQTC